MGKKTLLIIAGIWMFSSVYTEVFSQTIERIAYDEFTGNRTIITSHEAIQHAGFTGSASVTASFGRIETETAGVTDVYAMSIQVSSLDGFQMFPADSVYFMIDDERAQYELFQTEVERRGEGTFESSFIELNETDFEKFGKAKDLRFSIHGNVFTLTQNAKDAFLLVLNELNK